MSRPLCYDEQFTSLIKSNQISQFLFCFPIKVQTTAFYGFVTLETGLRICSIYDFLICLLIFSSQYQGYSIMEVVIMLLSLVFGINALMLSNSFNKRHSMFYYHWRITLLFLMPFLEFFEYNENSNCYYTNQCSSFMFYCGMSFGFTVINLYMTKISWSFLIRLELGQELVIIHGKYLEKMLSWETRKISNMNKYIPPSIDSNINENKDILIV